MKLTVEVDDEAERENKRRATFLMLAGMEEKGTTELLDKVSKELVGKSPCAAMAIAATLAAFAIKEAGGPQKVGANLFVHMFMTCLEATVEEPDEKNGHHQGPHTIN
jgi:hypothetical protein